MEKNYVAPEEVESLQIQIAEYNGYKSWEEFQEVLHTKYEARRKARYNALPFPKKVKHNVAALINKVVKPFGFVFGFDDPALY